MRTCYLVRMSNPDPLTQYAGIAVAIVSMILWYAGKGARALWRFIRKPRTVNRA